MVASSRLLHLAAAAATTSVATCFACPGGIGGAGARPASSAAADRFMTPPRTSSGSCSAADVQERSNGRFSTARRASPSAQEEAVLRTRGGGAAAAGVGSGADDPGLAETDAEVWQIVDAERRRQVSVCRKSRQESCVVVSLAARQAEGGAVERSTVLLPCAALCRVFFCGRPPLSLLDNHERSFRSKLRTAREL